MKSAVSVFVIVCFLQTQLHAAPSAATKHFRAGQAAFEAENYDQAIVEYKAALELEALPEYLFHLAQAYRLKKDKKTALDFYKQYLAIAPNGAQATQAKVYVASLSIEVAEEQRAAAPPPPPPQVAPPPPSYVPPPIYDRKLMRQRLSNCVDGPNDWSYCGYKQRTMGENDFISAYHRVTGRADLDANIDYSYRKRGYIIVGSLSAAFLVLTIIGGALTTIPTSYGADGSRSEGGLISGIVLSGFFGASFALTSLIGWPVAATRQPRGEHKISQQRAQAAVDAYNDALLHPFQNRSAE